MRSCYHCDLPVPPRSQFQVEIFNQPRDMCCPGCAAVAKSICDNGLTDYYQFRTEKAEKADEDLPNILQKLKYLDFPDIQKEFVTRRNETSEIVLSIDGITCSACSWLIERQLVKLNGIIRVNVNSSTHRALIHWDNKQLKLSDIIKTIQSVGYKAFPFQTDHQEHNHKQQLKSMLVSIGISGLMTMQVMMFAFALYFGLADDMDDTTLSYFHWISLALTIPVVSYCSTSFYASAYRALRQYHFNMDFSVSLAIIVIFVASAYATVSNSGNVYFESVSMFVFLLLVGRYMELKARSKATEISANMLKLLPLVATIEKNNVTETIPAKHLNVGDIFIVQAGETIPADGEVIDGCSNVNQSMLSGESNAIEKIIGAEVYAGTINNDSPLKIKVNKPQSENLVSTIIKLQDEANSHKPRVAEIADSFANWFGLGVLTIAAIGAFYWSSVSYQAALQVFVAVLVSTCPCALSLATPAAMTCAISRLNKAGILIRKANILQLLNDVRHFVFDKTGTLTLGKIKITQTNLYATISVQEAKQIAASLEKYSEHPIAAAFDNIETLLVENIINMPGQGIAGTINNQAYKLGKLSFVIDKTAKYPIEGDVFLSDGTTLLASFTLSDELRNDAAETVNQLKNSGYNCTILSGDSAVKVKSIASQLSINHYFANLSPQQKLEKINQLQQPNNKIVMVGDGINDVPVLAAADVSFAVSDASDLSKQGADIILLGINLSAITQSLTMAKKSQQIIKQNFAWAIGYNALALPLALTGILAPWMAVIGMSASSILVLSNSLRLNRLIL